MVSQKIMKIGYKTNLVLRDLVQSFKELFENIVDRGTDILNSNIM